VTTDFRPSSRTPPSDNAHEFAGPWPSLIDLPSEGLADAGRTDQAQDRPRSAYWRANCTARYSTMRSLTFSSP